MLVNLSSLHPKILIQKLIYSKKTIFAGEIEPVLVHVSEKTATSEVRNLQLRSRPKMSVVF